MHGDPSSAAKGSASANEDSTGGRHAASDEAEKQAERAEQDRLLALRDFAYGASHELNNPLANIVSRAESLLREEVDPERRRKLATIVAQAFRAHEMIADLMHFARPPAIRRAPVDLGELVAKTIDELQSDADENEVRLSAACESGLVVPADGEQLAAALRAVGRNAIEASSPGDAVEFEVVSLPATMDVQERVVEIRIIDRGTGFTADDRRRLFHPFYSGREAGRGLGLGLSKAWRIVTDHGGTIDITEASPKGACVIMRLLRPEDGQSFST
jgi:signal transduction histidine kinase